MSKARGFPRLDDSELTNWDTDAAVEFIWQALHDYQEFFYAPDFEEDWDNICIAMAWIKDAIEDGTAYLYVELEDDDGT